MRTQVTAKLEDGVNTMLRVVGTLRRKEFYVLDVEMRDLSGKAGSELTLTLDGDGDLTRRAVHQMEKVYGVSGIKML
ncbi:ACT domain-containing protein [Fusibacter sp. JL216-2]|uniref:ACT domain-containing protein n=1 Tax=Fusibacter sp. JL216-2 TaxID=3071453 RepID=UPI003D32828B